MLDSLTLSCYLFFFNDTATTEIYTLSLHDALPISSARSYGLLHDVAEQEGDVGGALGETAHEVRIPLFPKGDVDADVPPLAPQRVLQVAPYAVQHLELEAGRRDASPARERLRVRDDPDVVRRDPGVDAALEQLLHAADVVRIDIGFRRERDLGWLLVRPLAEPHPGPPGDHVRHVALGAPQIGLQHHADRVAELRVEALREEPQGRLGVGRAFHVDAHERVVLAGPRDDGADGVDAQALVDVEPHLRQPHGPVAGGARAVDAIGRLEVDVPGCPRLRGAAHRLAQEIEARRDAGGVEPLQGGDGVVDRFSGDEARREATRQAVPPDELEDAGLLAEPEEAGAQHRGAGPCS